MTFLDRESKKPRVVGRIDQLFIYPLKSGEGIDIPFAHAAEQFRIQRHQLDDFGNLIKSYGMVTRNF